MLNLLTKSIIVGLIMMAAAVAAKAADDRPVALVEHIEGATDTGLRMFQYVYQGDKIDLRAGGVLSLAYFDSCEVVTFTGGLVKLKKVGTSISKEGKAEKIVRPCQTAALAVSRESREAGASVKRVSPFSGEEWREISVPSALPLFVWPVADEDAEYTIAVYFLDAAEVQHVWEAPFENGYIIYPEDAPPLASGMPYEVVITSKGKRQSSIVFSIDPGLEFPDGPLTSAIPLGL